MSASFGSYLLRGKSPPAALPCLPVIPPVIYFAIHLSIGIGQGQVNYIAN
jgi:hypothetical protein